MKEQERTRKKLIISTTEVKQEWSKASNKIFHACVINLQHNRHTGKFAYLVTIPMQSASIFLKITLEKNDGSLQISFVTDLNSDIANGLLNIIFDLSHRKNKCKFQVYLALEDHPSGHRNADLF